MWTPSYPVKSNITCIPCRLLTSQPSSLPKPDTRPLHDLWFPLLPASESFCCYRNPILRHWGLRPNKTMAPGSSLEVLVAPFDSLYDDLGRKRIESTPSAEIRVGLTPSDARARQALHTMIDGHVSHDGKGRRGRVGLVTVDHAAQPDSYSIPHGVCRQELAVDADEGYTGPSEWGRETSEGPRPRLSCCCTRAYT